MTERGDSIKVLNPSPRKEMYSLVKEVENNYIVLKTGYSPVKIADYAAKHVKYPGKYLIVYNNGAVVLFHTTVYQDGIFKVPTFDKARMFSFFTHNRRV